MSELIFVLIGVVLIGFFLYMVLAVYLISIEGKESKMDCPVCKKKMIVINSRCNGDVTFRRYRCECGKNIYTREESVESAKSDLYLLESAIREEQRKEKKWTR